MDRIKEGGAAAQCQRLWKAMINSNTSHRSDDPLASEKIQVDRKVFFLDLKEDHRGCEWETRYNYVAGQRLPRFCGRPQPDR
jgi:hypothetical protein